MATSKNNNDPLSALASLVENPDAYEEDEVDPKFEEDMNKVLDLAAKLTNKSLFDMLELFAACQQACIEDVRDMIEGEES